MVFVRKRSFKSVVIYASLISLSSLGGHFSRCTWAFYHSKPPNLEFGDISSRFSATSSDFQVLECFSLSCAKLQSQRETAGIILLPQCTECQQHLGHLIISNSHNVESQKSNKIILLSHYHYMIPKWGHNIYFIFLLDIHKNKPGCY